MELDLNNLQVIVSDLDVEEGDYALFLCRSEINIYKVARTTKVTNGVAVEFLHWKEHQNGLVYLNPVDNKITVIKKRVFEDFQYQLLQTLFTSLPVDTNSLQTCKENNKILRRQIERFNETYRCWQQQLKGGCE